MQCTARRMDTRATVDRLHFGGIRGYLYIIRPTDFATISSSRCSLPFCASTQVERLCMALESPVSCKKTPLLKFGEMRSKHRLALADHGHLRRA